MQYETLPDRLLPAETDRHKVDFIPYVSGSPVIKGKSSLKKHLISLLTEGEKMIHVAGKQIHVAPSHILLLAAGNYLYTERFHQHQRIKSTMVFFDDDLLQNVIDQLKPGKPIEGDGGDQAKQPFALFAKDDYLRNFIESIQSLIDANLFTSPLQLIKLNELLMFLYSKYPEAFDRFQRSSRQRPEEERIKQGRMISGR
jgi:hypothetical protein